MEPLVAEGLRKSYGGTVALSGVSLSVPAGEVFALTGPNGAGKTTLVRCLTGTTDPDAGTARLFGVPPRAAEKSRLGLLPQEFDPPDRLTARELVAYYAGLYDGARDVDTVLSEVGMADSADTRYTDLSGGQRRRASVGTALVNDPDVLFLDEPTTGIDPAGRRAVWSLIEDLADAGTTVFLTTHYMEEAEHLADRVGVLRGGELAALDTPGALIEGYGGESRLVVETDAEIHLDGHEIDLGGYEVERMDRGIAVRGIGPDGIGDVVSALDAAGVDYDALSWREPDLETVYLELTGQAPRTAGAERASSSGEAGRTPSAAEGSMGGGPA